MYYPYDPAMAAYPFGGWVIIIIPSRFVGSYVYTHETRVYSLVDHEIEEEGVIRYDRPIQNIYSGVSNQSTMMAAMIVRWEGDIVVDTFFSFFLSFPCVCLIVGFSSSSISSCVSAIYAGYNLEKCCFVRWRLFPAPTCFFIFIFCADSI